MVPNHVIEVLAAVMFSRSILRNNQFPFFIIGRELRPGKITKVHRNIEPS